MSVLGIKEAGEAIEQGADKLGAALEAATRNIDPVGIRQLLDENETLRRKLMSVQLRMTSVLAGRTIQLENRDVEIELRTGWGKWRVEGWVDEPAKAFWSLDVLPNQAYPCFREQLNTKLSTPGIHAIRVRLTPLELAISNSASIAIGFQQNNGAVIASLTDITRSQDTPGFLLGHSLPEIAIWVEVPGIASPSNKKDQHH